MEDGLKRYFAYQCFFSDMGTKNAKNPSRDIVIKPSAEDILSEIDATPFGDFIEDILVAHDKVINAKNIPQISNLEMGSIEIVKMLKNHNDYGMTFVDIGKEFLGKGDRSENAYLKFGENHAKLARDLDLLFFLRQGSVYVYISKLGYAFLKYPEEKQKELLAKQMFLIPVVRYIIKQASVDRVDVVGMLTRYVSKETAIRRGHTVKKILTYISTYAHGYDHIWSNIE